MATKEEQAYDKRMKSYGKEVTIGTLSLKIQDLESRIRVLGMDLGGLLHRVTDLESKTDNLDERTFPMAIIGSTEI